MANLVAQRAQCKILRGKGFIGYCAAKKKYYYGVKVHMITTTLGAPVEFLIAPASIADITALKAMQIDVRLQLAPSGPVDQVLA